MRSFFRFLYAQKHWLISIGIIVFIFSIEGSEKEKVTPKPPPLPIVKCQILQTKNENQWLPLPGTIHPDVCVDISLESEGRIEQIFIPDGCLVAEGKPIAQLETSLQKADIERAEEQLRQLEALKKMTIASLNAAEISITQAQNSLSMSLSNINSARAEYDIAQLTLSRLEKLRTQSVVPKHEFDQAESRYRQAQAALEQAMTQEKQAILSQKITQSKLQETQASLEEVEARIKYGEANIRYLKVVMDKAQITAPFSGYIDRWLLKKGQFVQKAQILGKLVKLDPVRATVDIPESYIQFVSVGSKARISFPGLNQAETNHNWFEGNVALIGLVGDTNSHTFPVEVSVSNPAFKLRPGMIIRVEILLRTIPDAILIPIYTIMVDERGLYVMVMDKDKARRRSINIGFIRQYEVYIESGLKAGDKLIVIGGRELMDDQTVIETQSDGSS